MKQLRLTLQKLRAWENKIPLIFRRNEGRERERDRDRERKAVVSKTVDVLTYFSGSLDQHVIVFGQWPLQN